MKKLFISNQVPNSLSSILENMGFSLVYLPAEPSLPLPVSSHADMLIFENVIQKDYYESNKELFSGCDFILTEERFGAEYPRDILLNAFSVNGRLYGRIDALSEKVKDLYPDSVNLRQGYAKCSTLLLGENAITADKGIADTLINNGLQVLLITPGHISLPGYDYGFIGGASLVYEGKVIFFGNIKAHPDYENIKCFIEGKGYKIIFDESIPLTDFGGGVIK